MSNSRQHTPPTANSEEENPALEQATQAKETEETPEQPQAKDGQFTLWVQKVNAGIDKGPVDKTHGDRILRTNKLVVTVNEDGKIAGSTSTL